MLMTMKKKLKNNVINENLRPRAENNFLLNVISSRIFCDFTFSVEPAKTI